MRYILTAVFFLALSLLNGLLPVNVNTIILAFIIVKLIGDEQKK
jgi:hypothetical protein